MIQSDTGVHVNMLDTTYRIRSSADEERLHDTPHIRNCAREKACNRVLTAHKI